MSALEKRIEEEFFKGTQAVIQQKRLDSLLSIGGPSGLFVDTGGGFVHH